MSLKTSKKKVLFVHLLNDYSGSPHVLSQVIDATLQNSDISEVELFKGSRGDGFLSDKECVTHSYFYRSSTNKYVTLIVYLLSQLDLFFKLLKYYNQDVCIYVNTMLPFSAGIAGKLMKKEVIYHIHETSLKPDIFKSFLRFVIKKTAVKVIFVSDYLRRRENIENIENIKSFMIYNALPAVFSDAGNLAIYPFDSKKFNVLMICSLKAYKGVNEFVDLANMCRLKEEINFTLILNCLDHEIDQYFKGMNVPKNLSILPSQTNLVPFYRVANLVLNLSKPNEWVETFGLTILEAMTYGIPCIAPQIGGPTEIVRDKLDGYLISSSDTAVIGEKILELSNNRTLCNVLSASARQRSLDFSETEFQKALKNMFLD